MSTEVGQRVHAGGQPVRTALGQIDNQATMGLIPTATAVEVVAGHMIAGDSLRGIG